MNVRALIHALNNLTFGELTALEKRVRELRDEVDGLGLSEVGGILDEALSHLSRSDIKAFRKKVQHAVSRLGHLRGQVARAAPAARAASRAGS